MFTLTGNIVTTRFVRNFICSILLHNATYERTSMLNHCAAKQDFAKKIIEDEGLPEDEKEKIKVANISC